MSNPNSDVELSKLVIELLNGSITNDRFVRLDRLLAEDDNALDIYLSLLGNHSILKRQQFSVMDLVSADAASDPESTTMFIEELAEYEKNGKAVEVEKVAEKAEPVLTDEERERRIRAFIAEEKAMEAEERRLAEQERKKILECELRRRQRAQRAHSVVRKVRRYTTIGAMAAMLMVIGYLVYVIMQPVPPVSVATLTGGVDVRWSNPDLPTELDSPLRQGSIKLVEGTAEITFDEGARIILEAPVEIDLQDTNKAFMHLGKAAAEVPPRAQSFTINTPSASMVDLGTAFGVQVEEDGTSDLHVFKGNVAMIAGKYGDKKAAQQIVGAGQARCVKAGSFRIQNIPFTQTTFVRNVQSPYMPLPHDLTVRQSKPITCWRFNQDSKYFDSLEYFGNAKIETIGSDVGDDKPINALRLDGQNSYVLGKDKTENWAQSGFSQVLWVRPDAVTRQNIILNADSEGPYANYSRQLFMDSQGKFSFWILVMEPDLPGDYYPVTLTSSTVAQPGRWYHVAVTVAEKGDICLFVNGVEESYLSLNGLLLHFDPERNLIYIGSAACGVLDDRKRMDSFKGGLDEIARCNRVLTPGEIRQLYNSTITEYMK